MMPPELAIRAALLLGAGLVGARALRTASAATRHAMWRLIHVAVLALPLITLAAPRWMAVDGSLPGHARAFWESTTGAGAFASPDRGPSPEPPPGSAAPGAQLREGSSAARTGATGMAAAWAVGMVSVSLFYVVGYVRLWMLRRRSTPAALAWIASATRLASRFGLAGTPEVRTSPQVPGPLVCGVWRATILIPPDAATWPEARREAVLVHELSHIRRRDLRAQLLAQAVCAVHWFNPLAWLASGDMRRERELACDDAVLTAGVPASWYATELLAIASEALDQRAPAAALSMARPSEMEGRLLAMLAHRPRRMGPMARGVMPLLVAGAAVAVAGATGSSAGAVAMDTPVTPSRPATITNWVTMPTVVGDGVLAEAHVHEALTSPDRSRRERATLALAFTPGDAVVPGLLAALDDPDGHVREKAAVGLAWRRDPRIVPALLAAAGDADAQVREKVLVALAFSGDARADAALDRGRTDPDPSVRDKARELSVFR